jgi:hypothetical protein
MTKLPLSGFEVVVEETALNPVGSGSILAFRSVARVPDIHPKSPCGEIFSLRKIVFEEPSAISLNFVRLPR